MKASDHMKHLILLIIPLLLALSACGGQSDSLPEQLLTLRARDISYDQNRLEVVAGQPARIILRNEGALVHDFTIAAIDVSDVDVQSTVDEDTGGHEHAHAEDANDLHVAAAPGESGSVLFTPELLGEYEYYCTVEGHKEAGMAGTLVVTAAP